MPMALSIHLVAACGTGMGTLACILKQMGYRVTGSDAHVYPPMSDFLRANGIQLFDGYNAANLDHDPDLVIIGNAVSRDNPEAAAVLEKGFEYLSMPQAVNRFVAKDKKIILVTGTHGKTTTSSIMAHLLTSAGLDPSYMIGGILKDYDSSFRIGTGPYMVIEGDEYDTAFFDKGPKFMHYDPEILILNGIEFDHADIFSGIEQINGVFADLVNRNKAGCHIIACTGNPNLEQVLEKTAAQAERFGTGGDWQAGQASVDKGFNRFTVTGPGQRFKIRSRLPGEHNILNSLACIAAARRIGIQTDAIADAFYSFSGIKRRQEVRGVKRQITVMDDFAHHPTAVAETIKAVKPFYPRGRIVAVFEPRTNTSMRRFFQNSYPRAFAEADLVCICRPQVKKKIPDHEKFDTRRLVADIAKMGIPSYHFNDAREVIGFLLPELQPRDLVLIMSNGGFDNIHEALLKALE